LTDASCVYTHIYIFSNLYQIWQFQFPHMLSINFQFLIQITYVKAGVKPMQPSAISNQGEKKAVKT